MQKRLARCPALQQWSQLSAQVKQLEGELTGLKGAEKEVGVRRAWGGCCTAAPSAEFLTRS